MGLSLSVLVALVLLLPGAAFVFAVTRLHSPTAPSTGLEQQLSLSLAVALLAAIFAHAVAMGALLVVSACLPLHTPDLVAVVHLLAGGSGAHALDAARALGGHPFCISAYFLLATASMWLLGKRANKVLRHREQADWFSLLRPEDVGFVVLTADFVMGGETVLYKGVVKEFRIAKTGELERVVLKIAARKPLSRASLPEQPVPVRGYDPDQSDLWPDELDDSPRSLGHDWIEIPGEAVVLQMKDAKTINLDYFWITSTS
ncbi:hypothetical protein [Luteimonas abyssi]|uniref:hypothetical protein n=1 Tax=Luteimonas abyssi TaxID=1247514 RepID=UPI000737BA59|nr:hypothetical protein [Luteimonas abyssi]